MREASKAHALSSPSSKAPPSPPSSPPDVMESLRGSLPPNSNLRLSPLLDVETLGVWNRLLAPVICYTVHGVSF